MISALQPDQGKWMIKIHSQVTVLDQVEDLLWLLTESYIIIIVKAVRLMSIVCPGSRNLTLTLNKHYKVNLSQLTINPSHLNIHQLQLTKSSSISNSLFLRLGLFLSHPRFFCSRSNHLLQSLFLLQFVSHYQRSWPCGVLNSKCMLPTYHVLHDISNGYVMKFH